MMPKHSELTEVVLEIVDELKTLQKDSTKANVPPFMQETISKRNMLKRAENMDQEQRTELVRQVGNDAVLKLLKKRS